MSEYKYKLLIEKYLSNSCSIDQFIDTFSKTWRQDRDDGTASSYDLKFQRLINKIFTSCDCYSENPQNPIEITEQALRSELELLFYIWWG